MSLFLYDCVRGSVWMNDGYSLLQLLFPFLLTASCWKVLTYSMNNSPSQGKGYENTNVAVTQWFGCRSEICPLQTTVICFLLTAHLQMRKEKISIKWPNDYPSKSDITGKYQLAGGVAHLWGSDEGAERKWNFTLFEQCCSIYMTKWGVSGNFNSCGLCNMCSVKHFWMGTAWSAALRPSLEQALLSLSFWIAKARPG